jgi:hypothetical protein
MWPGTVSPATNQGLDVAAETRNRLAAIYLRGDRGVGAPLANHSLA